LVFIILPVSQASLVVLDIKCDFCLGFLSVDLDFPVFLGASPFWIDLSNCRAYYSARTKNFLYVLISSAKLYLHVGSQYWIIFSFHTLAQSQKRRIEF